MGGDKVVIDIKEYKVMFIGSVSVCYGEIMFVMDCILLRLIHADSDENGTKYNKF